MQNMIGITIIISLLSMMGCLGHDIKALIELIPEPEYNLSDEEYKYEDDEIYLEKDKNEKFSYYDIDKGPIAIGGIISRAKIKDEFTDNPKLVRNDFNLETVIKLGDIFSNKLQEDYDSNSPFSSSSVKRKLGEKEYKKMIEKIRESEYLNILNTENYGEWKLENGKIYKEKAISIYTKQNILNRTFKLDKSWRTKIKAKYLLFGILNCSIQISKFDYITKMWHLTMDIIVYNLYTGKIEHFGTYKARINSKNASTFESVFTRSVEYFPSDFDWEFIQRKVSN